MNTKIVIPVMFILLITVLAVSVEASPYCDGNVLYDNITVNGNEITVLIENCAGNCTNESISGLGNPGCEETELEMGALIIFIGLALFSLIMWVLKK